MVKALTPYPTKPGPQGSLRRYVVTLRFTADMEASPSGDQVESFTSWGEDPYSAVSAAIIAMRAVLRAELRRVVGVTEWPIPEGESDG